MCILIMATLPKNIDRSLLRKLIEEYDLAFEPVKNEYIIKQLDAKAEYLKVTKSGCDCNTGLGSFRILDKMPTQADLQIFEPNKAKEFLQDLEKRNNKLKDDAQRWLNIINEIFVINGIDSFGLLIHFYNSGLNESGEKFEIARVEYKIAKDITINYLIEMEENVLYLFLNK